VPLQQLCDYSVTLISATVINPIYGCYPPPTRTVNPALVVAYISGPPCTRVRWFQVVGALAIMMDMKKGVVNETVKENRADELSAMFNMMTDNRKRIMGW